MFVQVPSLIYGSKTVNLELHTGLSDRFVCGWLCGFGNVHRGRMMKQEGSSHPFRGSCKQTVEPRDFANPPSSASGAGVRPRSAGSRQGCEAFAEIGQ